MGYLLYQANGSGSAIVEAVLTELGVPYETSVVDGAAGAQREAQYAAVNPARKLPTLVTPEGETLTESVAIVLTLCERHPEPPLLPAPASPDRARALRFLVYAAAELYPLVEMYDYPERFTPEGHDKKAVYDLAQEMWKARWHVVNDELAQTQEAGPFLLGDHFCATDIYLGAMSRWLDRDWRAQNVPHVARLSDAVAERLALEEIWARNFPRG